MRGMRRRSSHYGSYSLGFYYFLGLCQCKLVPTTTRVWKEKITSYKTRNFLHQIRFRLICKPTIWNLFLRRNFFIKREYFSSFGSINLYITRNIITQTFIYLWIRSHCRIYSKHYSLYSCLRQIVYSFQPTLHPSSPTRRKIICNEKYLFHSIFISTHKYNNKDLNITINKQAYKA